MKSNMQLNKTIKSYHTNKEDLDRYQSKLSEINEKAEEMFDAMS